MKQLRYSIASTPTALEEFDEVLRLVCATEALDEQSYEIRLAVTEALATVVAHAYGGADSEPIDIAINKQSDHVTILITEHGHPIANDWVGTDVEPLLGEEPASALPDEGWGIYLMQTYMDHVDYEARENANVWTLIKELPRRAH
ncbi:MAG: ATP-binding protein [Pseudomonadota bacterium]